MIKRFIASFAAIISCAILAYAATSLDQYQPGFRTIDGSQLNKMVDIVNRLQGIGATPTFAQCGTSPAIVGSPTAGQITVGTGSPVGCVINFPTNYYSVAPYCTVTWQTVVASTQYSNSSNSLTLGQAATSSNVINYACLAR